MTPKFTPADQVEWKTVNYLERPDGTFEYRIVLPEPLASWDVYGCWERQRVHSMRDNLSQGDVLFDVGTEQGWCNLVYAQFVGPENMVLIEPTESFWPNIVHTWFKNFEVHPRAYYQGLMSDKTTDNRQVFNGQPQAAYGDLIDRNKYQYIHEHSDGIHEMRLDDMVERSGIVPDALTVDVEGAELLVLRGATETLREHRPLVWCSVHPDLMLRDYGCTPEQVHNYMASLGYKGEHLADDHESHWFFHP